MKKIFTTAVAILCLITISQAQDHKGYIGVTFGPSIPMGDYSSKNFNNDDAGFALTGFYIDFNFNYKLGGGNFGLAAMLRANSNDIDIYTLSEEIFNADRSLNWKFETSNYSVTSFMFGGFGAFPINEKIDFVPKALIGFASANSPYYKITASDKNNSAWIKQESGSGTAFTYLLGAGFNFDIGKKLILLTNLDYSACKPEFSNVEITDSAGDSQKTTFSVPISTFQIGVGLALKI